MVTVYDSKCDNFNNNGLCILNNVIKCEVKQTLNGEYCVELEYPTHDLKSNYLVEYNILKVNTPNGLQLFRIRSIEKFIDKIIVYATHIIFDLSDNFIMDCNIVNKTRIEAIEHLLNSTMSKHKFSVIGNDSTFINNVRIVRYSPLQAIFSHEDNTIIGRYGGEFDFNNFNIISKDRIGVDNGYTIEYGKNLVGLKATVDTSELCTVIVPQGYDNLFLPEYCVKSKFVNNYHQPFIRHYSFDDVRVIDKVDENNPVLVTKEQAENTLRNKCVELFKNGLDKPFLNIEVNFQTLSNIPEYKSFKHLESISLGDVVHVKYKPMDIDIKTRVIHYVWDGILNKYISIELSRMKKTLNMTINDIHTTVKNIDTKFSDEIKNVGLIQGKVLSKVEDVTTGLGNSIIQNAESVQIAWNKCSSNITFENGYLKISHSDGSYTKLSNDGLTKHFGGTATDYQYTTRVIGFVTNGTPKELNWIQLPEEFKGKHFNAYAMLSDTWTDSWDMGTPWVIRRMVVYAEQSQIDYANARVPVVGYRTDKNYKTDAYRHKPIAGMLVIIA